MNTKINNKLKNRIIAVLSFTAPPLLVFLVLGYAFKLLGLYPFGDQTISWCDMNQQVVPLMNDFKDILDGKSSMFLNFENAGGMNFWGVFFFFLASPFTFLIKFVAKENIMLFMNVMVILKLMLSSLTAMIYFRCCQKDLHRGIAIGLSIAYAFCGYGMMYYQNIIWLDMMYLFPLLMLALEKLTKNKNPLPYIGVISAMIAVNYYIGYMIVIFLLLFMGIYVFMHKDKGTDIYTKFIAGSAIAMLITAVVWIPSVLQFQSSARGKPLLESLKSSDFITAYETMLPLLFCSAFVIAAIVVFGFFARQNKNTKFYLCMFLLLTIPIFIEPINKMWHTGNYMSFPGRYAFITVFMGLICCAYFLKQQTNDKPAYPVYIQIPTALILAVTVFAYYRFADNYITRNFNTITEYSRTLWGNDDSLEQVSELFLIALVVFGAICLCYKKRVIGKDFFAVLLCFMVAAEGFTNSNIYMTSQTRIHGDANTNYQQQIALTDKIDDSSFYRVKTSRKLMDYNLIGSLGYPSISHYTSLTDKDYLFTMKRLGYSSVWMEQGSNGGTVFTDALLSMGYEISNDNNNSVYNSGDLYINKLPQKFNLGIVTSKDISNNAEIPEIYDRTVVQQYIYNSLFDDNALVTKYNPDTELNNFNGGKYHFNPMEELSYTIKVEGKQRLYFDCFDALTTNLSEPIYNALSISVNGEIMQNTYPTDTNNGVLDLGEYEDANITVKVAITSKLDCYSFGLFGIDENILSQTIENTPTVNFQRDKGILTGKCTAKSGQSCFLSVPYNDGFTIKVNGKSVDYNKTFGAFISFPLDEGENNITVSFAPKGFTAGLIISFIGIAAAIIYSVKRKQIPQIEKLNIITRYAVQVIFVLVIAAVYIIPVLINLIAANK